jgi:predicted GIY-YIG superfamily endonuclease
MSFWVYISCCADGSYYTGHTDNLEERMAKQTAETGGYASRRLPVKLVFSEDFQHEKKLCPVSRGSRVGVGKRNLHRS